MEATGQSKRSSVVFSKYFSLLYEPQTPNKGVRLCKNQIESNKRDESTVGIARYHRMLMREFSDALITPSLLVKERFSGLDSFQTSFIFCYGGVRRSRSKICQILDPFSNMFSSKLFFSCGNITTVLILHLRYPSSKRVPNPSRAEVQTHILGKASAVI